MCNIEVYGKIAHPFVMQYLVYFLASSASLNAIFTFSKCAYDFKYKKDLQHVGNKTKRIAISLHMKGL